MRCRLPITAFALSASLIVPTSPTFAETPSSYKVLSREQGGFNVSAVQELLNKGDESVANGDLVQAKQTFDKARDASKQLLSFYRDLGGSFRGLDARIPREMDKKGRKVMKLLAENLLFRFC